MPDPSAALANKRVAIFQTRRGEALAGFVRKHGGVPISAQVLREVELDPNPDAEEFARRLRAAEIDVLIVLTGVGHRRLMHQLEGHFETEQLPQLLSQITVAARGPKARHALREGGVTADVVAPEPYTWEGVLDVLTKHTALEGKRVAVQLYGAPHDLLCNGLEAAGAQPWPFYVYTWELPEDLQPALNAVDAMIEGQVDLVLFTSAPQVRHLLRIADDVGRGQELRRVLQELPIGSVGPSCTLGLQEAGLKPDFQPEHGKMGHLVREAGRFLSKISA